MYKWTAHQLTVSKPILYVVTYAKLSFRLCNFNFWTHPEVDPSRDRNMLEQSIVSQEILNNNSALFGMNLYLSNNYARYESYKIYKY
jgi:hypothetical protein